MALNIKDRRVRELARQLADLTHTTLTGAVKLALEEALARRHEPSDGTLARLNAISNQCSKLPLLDSRTADDILGYDDTGLPE
jgi:antitoxin VapB